MNESIPGNNHLPCEQLLQQPPSSRSDPAEDGVSWNVLCVFTGTQASQGRDGSEELREAGALG